MVTIGNNHEVVRLFVATVVNMEPILMQEYKEALFTIWDNASSPPPPGSALNPGGGGGGGDSNVLCFI